MYCVVSTTFVMVKHWRDKWRAGEQEPADLGNKSRAPIGYLVAVGVLNGLSNFLMAVAQPHTAGLTQSLLGTLGVPLVMLLSFVFLHKRPTFQNICGAGLIVAGTALSGM